MPIKVLLVDRDRRARDAMASVLDTGEIEVVEASASAEAIARVNEDHPTIAVIDVPTLGEQAAREALQIREAAESPLELVAVAGDEQRARVADLVSAGARAFVTKTNVQELLEAVKAVNDGSGLVGVAVAGPVLDEAARLAGEGRRNRELEELVDQLQALSVTDWLTGLKNHGYFYERLSEELDRALRHRRPLAVIFADLDDFKAVNDSHGHPEGDRVLQLAGAVMSEEVRSADIVCRIGGEEFGVLLPETDAGGALLVAERIRIRLGESSVPGVGTVTVSLGVSAVPEHAVERDDLLEAADRALYLAKREGKNRSRLAGQVVPLATGAPRDKSTQVVDLLLRVLRMRDPRLASHALRTAEVAVALGAKLELVATDLEHLRIAALVQDVGKIGLPDAVIFNEGPLSKEGWAAMRTHPERGFVLIQNLVHPVVAETVLNNHERFDGDGYPNGVAGESIPLLARVLLVADAYVAMTTPRDYRSPMSSTGAVAELEANSGRQFDPVVVKAMSAMTGALELGAEAYGADGVVDLGTADAG